MPTDLRATRTPGGLGGGSQGRYVWLVLYRTTSQGVDGVGVFSTVEAAKAFAPSRKWHTIGRWCVDEP